MVCCSCVLGPLRTFVGGFDDVSVDVLWAGVFDVGGFSLVLIYILFACDL